MARAEINDLVGRAHDGGLVLNQDDGVAGVAQLPDDADQPGGVAGMQPHARLIQNKQSVDKT